MKTQGEEAISKQGERPQKKQPSNTLTLNFQTLVQENKSLWLKPPSPGCFAMEAHVDQHRLWPGAASQLKPGGPQ